jgi:hypothetical protein
LKQSKLYYERCDQEKEHGSREAPSNDASKKKRTSISPVKLENKHTQYRRICGKRREQPAQMWTNIVAHSVINKTTVVAAIIRAGISQFGDLRETGATAPEGNSLQIAARKATTTSKDRTGGADTEFNMSATAKYAIQQPTKLLAQLSLKERILKTRQDVEREISPISVPSAAPEAKMVPCSSAKKIKTGPDVRGRPRIKPPIV